MFPALLRPQFARGGITSDVDAVRGGNGRLTIEVGGESGEGAFIVGSREGLGSYSDISPVSGADAAGSWPRRIVKPIAEGLGLIIS